MTPRTFGILTGLACVNTVTCAVCYSLAGKGSGASFEGLVPSLICMGSLGFSALLTGFGWNELLKELQHNRISRRAVVATLLAAAPLLFLLGGILSHRLTTKVSTKAATKVGEPGRVPAQA